jgi:hypothetical protein
MTTEAAAGTSTTGWCRTAIGLGEALFPYLYRQDPQRVIQVGLAHTDPLEEYPDE